MQLEQSSAKQYGQSGGCASPGVAGTIPNTVSRFLTFQGRKPLVLEGQTTSKNHEQTGSTIKAAEPVASGADIFLMRNCAALVMGWHSYIAL
ncbi:hypothetical protein GX50_04689 [[Emmonsia] crescens]|uniref:Uncharacterized protein n=1 Tax=[Emmonsia] crescens TaxID=73230 RepID=A0A2B7ZFY7_9EURO|nr:hypothetical protein GX50_04689 [Emmonsia crescens]